MSTLEKTSNSIDPIIVFSKTFLFKVFLIDTLKAFTLFIFFFFMWITEPFSFLIIIFKSTCLIFLFINQYHKKKIFVSKCWLIMNGKMAEDLNIGLRL